MIENKTFLDKKLSQNHVACLYNSNTGTSEYDVEVYKPATLAKILENEDLDAGEYEVVVFTKTPKFKVEHLGRIKVKQVSVSISSEVDN